LAEAGLVHMGPGKPTVVARRAQDAGEAGVRDELGPFLAGVLREGRERFGLTCLELVRGLERTASGVGRSDVVQVVECSEGQSLAHAQEIAARWRVEARPWCLDQPGEPPAGRIIATFFHFEEIRRRWPRRQGDIQFVAIHPDPQLPERIRARLGGNPAKVLLYERDASMAANVAMDLKTIFEPCGVQVEPRVLDEDGQVRLAPGDTEICLFAPRVWGRLNPALRRHPRALEAAYRIRHADLEALGPFLSGARP
jgi:hypothetical protein